MNIPIYHSVRWLPLMVFLAAVSSCNLSIGAPSPNNPQFIIVTATLEAGKSESFLPSATLEPTLTQTPSVTLTPTLTATPTKAEITMTAGQDLSCVKGPKWDLYDWVAKITMGETVILLARAPSEWGEYYYVRLSNGTECWAFGGSSTKNGDVSSLPIKEAPPTPTPKITVDYSVSYLSITHCAPDYAFRFQVTNTGTVTLESIRIIITDNTHSITRTHQLNSFRSYNGCVLESNVDSLSPGQTAIVANVNPGQFNYNPAWDSITAAFTVCSADGLGGVCVDRAINFFA